MNDDGYIKDGLVFAMAGGLLVDIAKNNAITNNGATPTTDHNGRANRGWAFDGVNDKIVLPNSLVRNKSLLTIEFGFQRQQGAVGYVLSAGDTTANRISVFVSDTGLNVTIGDGTVANNSVYTLWPGNFDSSYHHFAFVFDGSKMGNDARIKMWIDGISRTVLTTSGTIPAVISNVDNELSIGNRGPAYFSGKLDLLNIYDEGLFSSQIIKNRQYWGSH